MASAHAKAREERINAPAWKKELAKELLAPRPIHFPRRKIYASKVNEIWTSDLMDMHRYQAQNQGYNWIIIVLDVFSRYAFARPLKRKTGSETAAALEEIFQKSKASPTYLWCDAGSEYYNHNVQDVLKVRGITLYSTHNTIKASIAERFIRTLRRKIESNYILTDSTVWYKVLPHLIFEYNTTRHRSLKMTPLQATKPENFTFLYAKQFEHQPMLPERPKFYIGQKVRTSLDKKIFEKECTQAWSEEIFEIDDILPTIPIVYKLRDLSGEKLSGTFYKDQLMSTTQSIYRIERVIRRRRNAAGEQEALVKWRDYDDKFNSWVKSDTIHRGGNGN